MTEKPKRKIYPEKLFKTQKDFRRWLEKHWDKSDGVQVIFYKKASGKTGLTYEQAIDEVLCFGWIDSTVRRKDEESYLQQFNPRNPKGNWTVLNKRKFARLKKAGLVQEGGLKAVAAAKKNGSWQNSYTNPTETKIPKEFELRLKKSKKAYEFFKTLSKTQQFYFTYWIHMAKRPETKEKRIKTSIEMLERGEKRM